MNLDELSPVNWLAHVLYAREIRRAAGLPEGAAVQVARWLVTNDKERTKARALVDDYAKEQGLTVEGIETRLRGMPAYTAWVNGELSAAAVRRS